MPASSLAIFSAPTPGRVHQRARELCGHHPCWLRRAHDGGRFQIDHFRVCSYCACVHPADLEELLAGGRSLLELAERPGKIWLLTPNPIAGELIRMGSHPGRIFDRANEPIRLRERLRATPRPDLQFDPSRAERLAGHFEKPCFEPAPDWIRWPFYSEHSSAPHWADLEAAAFQGA